MADIRVFISYSHFDRPLAQRVRDYLSTRDFLVLWDGDLKGGTKFDPQLRSYIAHSHIFLPIITEGSMQRGWVQQEIGFATALNVPVLPLAVALPANGMLEGVQTVMLANVNANLEDARLIEQMMDLLARSVGEPGHALYQCADLAEARARMMREHADAVRLLGHSAVVRQAGALTSFHIPTETARHRVWTERYGGQARSDDYIELQRNERAALKGHCDAAGCRLIIRPELDYSEYGTAARVTRLRGLLSFLSSMRDDKVRIAHGPHMDTGENRTILGDWFSATSLSGQLRRGYRQTVFTRHTPTVRAHLARFDEEFEEALKDNPWPDAPSERLGAMAFLEDLIAKI